MWITSELHCHTLHSDGKFTVNELIETAHKKGLQCIALTDHNTNSGYIEVPKDSIIPAINGFEWTTYFGHMIVLESKKFVDWRFATPYNIDEKIIEIRKNEGVVGIAHPFRPGSPFCTGCCWDFNLKDWSLPHYIEIWSGVDPFHDIYNQIAYEFWIQKLDEGIHLAITHGKDWHGVDNTLQLDGFTLLNVNEITTKSCIEAIKNGRSIISVGPVIELNIDNYIVGDTITKGLHTININIKNTLLRKSINEQLGIKITGFELLSDGGKIIFSAKSTKVTTKIEVTGKYIFARVLGITNKHKEPFPLAITSPIYFNY